MRSARIKSWMPVVALVAGWIAAVVVVAALLVAERTTTLDRAHRSVAGIARIIEEQSARTFQATGLTLGALADTWELSRPPKHDPAFRRLLQQRLRDLPYARALFVVGADGILIHDTGQPPAPSFSLADRDYFRIHRENPGLRQAVSGPYLSRRAPGAGWFIAVTRALGHGERFEGIAVAAVEPAYFETLYGNIRLDDDEVISLFHRDGTLMARHPAAGEALGRSFLDLALFSTQLPRRTRGTYAAEDEMFPGRQIVGYGVVPGLPLVVRVARSEHTLLAEWQRGAVGAGLAMGVLTLLLGGLLAQQIRARARRERERAGRFQAERLEAMGQLTGGIAHDFANLLNVLSINLALIERDPTDAEGAASAAASARRAVERGTVLIRRLLAFAKQQPLDLRAADLNSLVTATHPLVAQAAGPRIELVLELAPGLPAVLVDETQFEMALLNLVVNARDALSGRGRIVLRTHAALPGGPCLTVEDAGPGMSEAIRRRALEPFFSTKGASGTGLGLPQVYGFMRQIGGSLEIDSAPGRGTRVHLRFPRAPALTAVNAGA